jgi:hypothetical protein
VAAAPGPLPLPLPGLCLSPPITRLPESILASVLELCVKAPRDLRSVISGSQALTDNMRPALTDT